MGQEQLLSSTVELGLDLLEKHGSFLPFCRAINSAGERFVYGSESDQPFTEAQASESVRSAILLDLRSRDLVGVAFCHHARVRFSDSDQMVPAIEVELHYRGQPAAAWHFPYKMEGKTAEVLEYYTNRADQDLFADAGPAPDDEPGRRSGS